MSDDSTKNDEESLFLSQMAGVKPLKPDNRVPTRKTPRKSLQQADQTAAGFAIDDVFSDAEIIEDCPDILSFSRSGLQHNVLKKLRQGKHPVENILDLHGLTGTEARKELQALL